MSKLISCISLLLINLLITAQTEEKILFNKGIKAYNNKDFSAALDFFNESYKTNSDYSPALFNAANSAYLIDSLNIAKDLYSEYALSQKDKIKKSKGFYNLGNVHYKEYEKNAKNPQKSQESIKSLIESIDAYKKAVRNNPKDLDARHNLNLAISKLPPPNQNNDQQNKNGDNKDEENKDNKDQENKDGEGKGDQNKQGENDKKEGGENKEQGDKGNEDGEKKDGEGKSEEEKRKEKEKKKQDEASKGKNGEEPKDQQEMKGKISRMQAAKDLDAMNNDEQKILMKVNRKKGDEKQQNSSAKDW